MKKSIYTICVFWTITLLVSISFHSRALDTQWAVAKDNVQYVRIESNDKHGEYEVSAFGIIDPNAKSLNIRSSVNFPIPKTDGDTVPTPYPVKYVGMNFAGGNDSIRSVSIDGGISIINLMAFADCSNLQSVSIGSCDSIGSGAFSNCKSLTGINIPPSTSKIGQELFSNCSSLRFASMGGATEIPFKTFYKCNSLTSVNLGNPSLIRQYAFDTCDLLSSISIPASVDSIECRAFCDCPNLKDVYLAEGGRIRLGPAAFYNCGIDHLSICRPTEFYHDTFGYDSSCRILYLGANASFYIVNDTRTNEIPVFSEFKNLQVVIVNSNDPLAINIPLFQDVIFDNVILKIPEGSKDAYEKNPYWRQFRNIEEIEMNGSYEIGTDTFDKLEYKIDGSQITVNSYKGILELYDISGELIAISQNGVLPLPPSGIYILRNKSKSVKIKI